MEETRAPLTKSAHKQPSKEWLQLQFDQKFKTEMKSIS